MSITKELDAASMEDIRKLAYTGSVNGHAFPGGSLRALQIILQRNADRDRRISELEAEVKAGSFTNAMNVTILPSLAVKLLSEERDAAKSSVVELKAELAKKHIEASEEHDYLKKELNVARAFLGRTERERDAAIQQADRAEAERYSILAVLPDNATCKFEETGESIADNVRDLIKRAERAEAERDKAIRFWQEGEARITELVAECHKYDAKIDTLRTLYERDTQSAGRMIYNLGQERDSRTLRSGELRGVVQDLVEAVEKHSEGVTDFVDYEGPKSTLWHLRKALASARAILAS